MSAADIQALWISLRLAITTTALLLLLGVPLAWWLARSRHFLRSWVDALIALPLVLPPTVIGFYVLLLLSPRGPLHSALHVLGLDSLVFTFAGLLIGSLIYSLPFAIQPLRDAFAATPSRVLEAAQTLRAAPLDRFIHVALPLARNGFLTAGALTFAHTLGEFGVVLMLGGNIPGRTRTASVAIFDHVESMQYDDAHRLAIVLLISCFALLMMVQRLAPRTRAAPP